MSNIAQQTAHGRVRAVTGSLEEGGAVAGPGQFVLDCGVTLQRPVAVLQMVLGCKVLQERKEVLAAAGDGSRGIESGGEGP